MILSSLKNTDSIESLHPLFREAFSYIRNTDFSKIADGCHKIMGDLLYVNVQTIKGKDLEQATIETHEKYIDIQAPLSAVEQIGWKAAADLTDNTSAYNEEDDIAFYNDDPTTVISIYPGQYAIFFPEDGHAPGIGNGIIKKMVVKVKI